jgi:outer membrane protein TolC
LPAPIEVVAAQTQVATFQQTLAAAQEQCVSEQRRFQAGDSTVFRVFQRHTGYISARSSEVRTSVDPAEAIANMDRATARTTEAHQNKLPSKA